MAQQYINENRPIYITYARNKSDHPGWEHIQDIKDEIVTKLRQNNIDIWDDDGDLKVGDRITEFEEEIGDSEFTILVFSDKYFRSHHCMYEFAQIKKAVKENKKKKLICIKSGNCKLDDVNYIDELRKYWADYAAEKTRIKIMKSRKLTPIEDAAEQNGYYADYIDDLYNFFSDQKYLNANSLDINAIINDFKLLFETEYYLYIDNKPTGPFDIRTLKRKLKLYPKTIFVWKIGMDSPAQAYTIPELKSLFPVEPPPIPTIISKPSVVVDKEIHTSNIIGKNQSFNVRGVSFNMIFVPGGTFRMGSNDYDSEKPIHDVTLDGFYIGETQVTQGLWKAVMGDNPSNFKTGDNYPVECVSWDDCQVFINQLNEKTGKKFRLPTEAEWEYAARGGKSGGTKYSGSDNIDDVAVYYDNSYKLGSNNSAYGTHQVKSQKPNTLGIYDMSGNVWEWCNDWYASDYYKNSPSNNPQGPSSGSRRVLRGGSWSHSANFCRVANRSRDYPGIRNYNYGLRLALVP